MPRYILAPALKQDSIPRRGFLARAAALLAGGAMLGRAGRAQAATQDGDPFVGEIAIVPFNFAPTGWAFCNGQLLSISSNTALFSLLGTTFGGNGTTNFALPNLQGRFPMHVGNGHVLGELSGAETHTLIVSEIPPHSHVLMADSGNGTSDTPTGLLNAKNPAGIPQYGANAVANMSPGAIANAGGGFPHSILNPYLTLNFIIALQGIFPSRP
jgi:microcystin-dependent protein